MRDLAWILPLVLATSIVVGQESAAPAPGADLDCSKVVMLPGRPRFDCEHTKWIGSVLRSIKAVKPGMSRKELLTVFTTEGGLSTPTHRTYVYKLCPYIKVDVEFAPAETDGRFTEMPEDQIVKISKPYLDYSVAD